MKQTTESLTFKSGYSDVNGLKMYYEIYGEGKPLVLIHGGGSTIQTSFGRIIPMLARHRQIIAVELQAHGHTNDRNTNLTFEQDANDVAKLLGNLKIAKADFLGFSNGGQTAIELAIHHAALINKLILASAFYKRNAVPAQFWEGFNYATLKDMPQFLKEEQLKANGNDTNALLNMFNKDVQRMKAFKDWADEEMKSINAPALIINGTADVSSPEHTVEMYRLIPHSELAIIPGGHGEYIGEITTLKPGYKESDFVVPMIENFLDKSIG